jgi:hypothetical protein
MNRLLQPVAGLALFLGLCGTPAFAMGPVDGEIGAAWWANDFSASGNGSSVDASAGAPGFRAELWLFKRYGLRAERYSSDGADLGASSTDYTSVDFRWRAFSPTENNFLALGAGWQQMDMATLGLEGNTSGARLGLEGRVAAGGLFYFYGQGSYLPSLSDTPAVDPALGRFENMSGWEYEAGVSWKMFPFLSMRGGYRSQRVDFTRTGYEILPGEEDSMDGAVESSGFLLGLSFRF